MQYALSGKCVITQVNEGGQEILVVKGPCAITEEEQTVKVSLESFLDWQRGAYIQDAMAYLSPDDREFLITGYSKEGWELMFSAQDDALGVLEADGSLNLVD